MEAGAGFDAGDEARVVPCDEDDDEVEDMRADVEVTSVLDDAEDDGIKMTSSSSFSSSSAPSCFATWRVDRALLLDCVCCSPPVLPDPVFGGRGEVVEEEEEEKDDDDDEAER